MSNVKRYVLPYFYITLASVIYAVGFNWCFTPNQIGFGGITGVAQIINAALPWAPIGTAVIVLNIPLFILGWKFIGGHLLVSSLYAMFVSSIAIDAINAIHTFLPMDHMLATIYGGVLMGLSLGVVFQQGATTGGTDLIARLVKIKLPWLPMGNLLMGIDLVVILAVALAFGNLNSALYGMVALFLTSKLMDVVLYGLDNTKVAYIISDSYQAISDKIVKDLDRGVTFLKGEGAYSGAEKHVIMCAFKQRQIVIIKRLVTEIDPAAFIVVCDAHEVLGEGFRQYKQNDL